MEYNVKNYFIKTITELNSTLLENQNEFQEDFFKRFSLRNAKNPLQLCPKISKNYFFPTLYKNVTTSVATFFCSHKEAQNLMPDPTIKVLSMGFGRSFVAISSYNYGTVLGMPSYNEIAISIPVIMGVPQRIPILPIIADPFRRLGYYVLSMPVTSLENRIRGHKLWGLPKVLQEIDLFREGDDYVTATREKSGEEYLRLKIPTYGKKKEFNQPVFIYSQNNEKLVRSVSYTQGVFCVNNWPAGFVLKGQKPKRPFLELKETASTSFLRKLQIEKQPFQTRFGVKILSAFDLPCSYTERRKI